MVRPRLAAFFPDRRELSQPERVALAIMLAALLAIWLWLAVDLWREGGWAALWSSIHFEVATVVLSTLYALGGRLLRRPRRNPEPEIRP